MARTRAIPVTPERDVQKMILQYLSLAGITAWRFNSGGVMLPGRGGKSQFVRFNRASGCSDILGILPGGRFLALEVKRKGGKATDQQHAFLSAVSAAGGLALICDSVETLRQQLRTAGVNAP